MYSIEVIAIKNELYETLQVACDTLNKVQKQFFFEIPEERLRSGNEFYLQDEYSTEEAFEYITKYRNVAKGNRPCQILVLDAPLYKLDGLGNLFGYHRASEGMAVFTTHTSDRYEKDLQRFCSYYLVRYALSFIAPDLKSHQRETDQDCMFHKKMNKAEIQHSLVGGKICDECKKIIRVKMSGKEMESIKDLLLVITNRFPHALIMKGGGVKGLAFAGALSVMEKHFEFDCFAGTSAGAITAVLLGAGYQAKDLKEKLETLKFKTFKDSRFPKTIYNLIVHKGLYPGNVFQKWIKDLIKEKTPDLESDIKMRDLEKFRTIIYASRIKEGCYPFDSKGEHSDTDVDFAVRCSMSIPYFFIPQKIEKVKVYDGGLRDNFPVAKFMNTLSNKPFIGFYLRSHSKPSKFAILEILNMTIDGEEKKLVDKHRDKIVVIDPAPIETTDFDLNDDDKQYLVTTGKLAAVKFLKRYYPGRFTEENEMAAWEKEFFELKEKAIKRKRRKNLWKWTKRILVVAAIVCGWLFGPNLYAMLSPFTKSELIKDLSYDGKMHIVIYEKKDTKVRYQVQDWFNDTAVHKKYDLEDFLLEFFKTKPINVSNKIMKIDNDVKKIRSIVFSFPQTREASFAGMEFTVDKNYFDNHFSVTNDDYYDNWNFYPDNDKLIIVNRDTIRYHDIVFKPKKHSDE